MSLIKRTSTSANSNNNNDYENLENGQINPDSSSSMNSNLISNINGNNITSSSSIATTTATSTASQAIHSSSLMRDGNKEDEKDEKNQKYYQSRLVVAGLVVVWYSVAVIAITTSKMVMNQEQLPFFLCTTQFFFATIITTLILQYRNVNKAKSISSSSSLSLLLSTTTLSIKAFRSFIYPIAFSYTFGFIFTNISFSLAAPSFAETIKSGEPISSVFLGYFFFNEGTTLWTYLTLIPICLGVGISCADGITFHWWGFVFAMLSNFCFSGRAVISKRMFAQHAQACDEFELFHLISAIGLCVLIPLTLFLEGSQIIRVFTMGSVLPWEWIRLLCLNGVAYSTYNLVSFAVLARTDLVTHAVLNVFRRVFIIMFTAWFFHNVLTLLNVAGVSLAVTGVLLFALSKHREKRMVSTSK